MKSKMLGREEILKSIVDALKPLDYVFGVWQCGSVAFGRVDEWSDLDVIVDVEDDKVEEVFKVTDKILESLSPIEDTIGVFQTVWQGAYEKIYKLKNTCKFLMVEICVVKHSSPNKFLQKEIHGDVVVHFDKRNITDIKPINRNEFAEKLKLRLQQLEKSFNMFQILVEKELNRLNYIEALGYYHNFALNPLVEVLRVKYNPFRYNFKTRYVYYDLPEDIVNRLHDFYFIKDGQDLKLKHDAIMKWFNEIINELKILNIEEIL